MSYILISEKNLVTQRRERDYSVGAIIMKSMLGNLQRLAHFICGQSPRRYSRVGKFPIAGDAFEKLFDKSLHFLVNSWFNNDVIHDVSF